MNRRIKELSDDAYLIARSTQSIHSPELLRTYTEKFAELIVQDAVNTLRKRWFDANNSIPATSAARLRAIHNGRKIGLMESVDALVEHFGVEL